MRGMPRLLLGLCVISLCVGVCRATRGNASSSPGSMCHISLCVGVCRAMRGNASSSPGFMCHLSMCWCV